MRFEVSGVVAYAATGGMPIDPEKESVVFIHGVGHDHTVWVLPSRYFARHGRNVLALDLPGHGRSGGAPLETIEEMADWVIDAVEAAGLEKAAMVGHSMGSLVALDAASRHPQRVRALVMVGVSFPLAVAEPLMRSAKQDSHDAIDMLTYWDRGNAATVGGSPTPGMWMAGEGMRLLERAGPGVIHTDLAACDGYTEGAQRASAVRCPTLLLLGERDRLTPVRGAQSIRETIADQDTVVFEGAGHPLLLERSDPVLDELIKVV
jgi:pimeloyl-ACP methyl ester carboxylesterase